MLRRKRQKCQAALRSVNEDPVEVGFFIETTNWSDSSLVLSYHPTWNVGTVAASRFGTLKSAPADECHLNAGRKPSEMMDAPDVISFAQGVGVPYLTLS